jgi:thymidylate synthase
MSNETKSTPIEKQVCKEDGFPYIYKSVSDAYLGILRDVYENPDYVHDAFTAQDCEVDDYVKSDPNWFFNKTAKQEKVNYRFIISKPKIEPITTLCKKRNEIIYDYSDKETVIFDNGDLVGIKTLSKVWERIANPDGTINANYVYMVYHLKDAGNEKFSETMLSQWEWAKDRLKRLYRTNQAYIHFNRPKDQWLLNKDQPCCMNIQFQIRDVAYKDVEGDKLEGVNVGDPDKPAAPCKSHYKQISMYVNMRSNDLVYGVPYNMLYFVKLLHRMRDELVAEAGYADLEIGNYYYHAVSLHFYLKHKDKVESMLG